MNDTRRKRIFIILAVIVVLLLGVIIWVNFAKKSSSSGLSDKGNLVGQGELMPDASNSINKGIPLNTNSGLSTLTQNTENAVPRRFVQLSETPVAGATFITSGNHSIVRYISKENGFIYDVDPKTLATTQITNTTFVRGVEEAFWAQGGNVIIVRYVDRDPINQHEIIKTYLGTIEKNSGENSTPGKTIGLFLQDNISAVTVSPDGTKIFYLIPAENSVNGVLYNIITQKGTAIFQNSFREWTPQFINNDELIFTTKPSVDVPGFSYRYNIKTSALTRFLREKNGLTVNTAPDGKFAMLSEKLLGNYYTNIWSKTGYAADEGLVLEQMTLPFLSISDKCAWPKGGNSLYCAGFTTPNSAEIPDDWYQGAVILRDKFWKAERTTGEVTLIGDPQLDLKAAFDSKNPMVSPDETSLIFTNKTDEMLWLLNIIPYTSPAQNESSTTPGKDE